MSKQRKRLTDAEAKSLGFQPKGRYEDTTNGKYYLTKEQLTALKALRKYKKVTSEAHEVNHTAKILTFDLEISPSQSFIWSKFSNFIPDEMLVSDFYLLTWSAKWLHEDNVMSAKLKPQEAIDENDKRIVQSLWKLLDEADICVFHNGDAFDKKKIQTRFLQHGMDLPSSYQTIDTVKVARKAFGLLSNKLDYIAQKLNVGAKVKHEGFSMWRKAMKGDKKALDDMSKYNDMDVIVNENVYKKLRKYMTNHPNLNNYAYDDALICPSCGANESELESTGTFSTNANSYDEVKCKCCGSRAKYNKKRTKLSNVTR